MINAYGIIAILLAGFVQASFAQPLGGFRDRNPVAVHGKIVSDRDVQFQDLQVTLQVAGRTSMRSTAQVFADGSFRMTVAPPGTYRLTVLNPRGVEVYSGIVSVDAFAPELLIKLPELPGDKAVTGTVSVETLRRTVPEKARKQYRRAMRQHRKGNTDKAIAGLEKALEVDEKFVAAHASLGVVFLKLEQYDQALEHLQKAARLDPTSAPVYTNASIALFSVHRFHDAEAAARAAIRLDAGDPLAHHILGLSLMLTDRHTEEALTSLRHAAKSSPRAGLAAAQLLLDMNRVEEAVRELRRYLRSGSSLYQEEAAQLLRKLEESGAAGAESGLEISE